MKKFFKKKAKSQKYDKRRALKCELLKKSDTHKGYCKYMVTIGEKDGTVHKQPAYGTDMQDALSRLINTERTLKFEKKLESNVGYVFLLWILIFSWPAIFVDDFSKPTFLLYAFGSVFLMFTAAAMWYKYISKGK